MTTDSSSPAARATSSTGLRRFALGLRRDPLVLFMLAVVCSIVVAVAFAPFIAPRSPDLIDLTARFLPPFAVGQTGTAVLGTDHLGRDVLSRILYGGRTSLVISATAVAVAGAFGISVGLYVGYRRGLVAEGIMRVVDVAQAFPFMVVAVTVAVVFRPGPLTLICTIVLWGWVKFARVSRAEVLSGRTKEYVEAAIALGATDVRVLFRHILPNMLAPLIVIATISFGEVVIIEGMVSFLGLGVQPPGVSWGTMISEGQANIFSGWWIGTFPGLFLTMLVVGVNLVGDVLRDALDPKYLSTSSRF